MSQLLFHNARVRTMAPARPEAEAVAVRDERIAAVGSEAEAAGALENGAERVDCRGGELLPGFIDAHCHLLAYAAASLSIDCSEARSIREVQAAIEHRAVQTPKGRWLRAFGYEETALAEQRHPTRHDLDVAAPEHPVRLIHRSGHGSVLNTLALRFAGIDATTVEPPGGGIGRDADGEPNGMLLGMEAVLQGVVPPLAYEELSEAVRASAHGMLRDGITCIQDGTHTNGSSEWRLFEQLIADGAIPFNVVLMEGIEHLGELPARGAGGRLRRGPVKIMLHELGDELSPAEDELMRMVRVVHDAGRQAAIHAVGERAVAAAYGAIDAALRHTPRDDHRHRIEHCSQLPKGLAPKLSERGIVVVSQPSLVSERGDRYRQLVPEEQQGGLYAFRTLRDAGVELAAGSDAPVTEPVPLASVTAAVQRRTAGGSVLVPKQTVCPNDALHWWTHGAARSAFLEAERGSLRAGLLADLVLLSPGAAEDVSKAAVLDVWRTGQRMQPD